MRHTGTAMPRNSGDALADEREVLGVHVWWTGGNHPPVTGSNRPGVCVRARIRLAAGWRTLRGGRDGAETNQDVRSGVGDQLRGDHGWPFARLAVPAKARCVPVLTLRRDRVADRGDRDSRRDQLPGGEKEPGDRRPDGGRRTGAPGSSNGRAARRGLDNDWGDAGHCGRFRAGAAGR